MVIVPDYEELIHELGSVKQDDLARRGFEALTVGFANDVLATERDGLKVVVKRYTELAYLRTDASAVGVVDLHASKHGLGPRVLHSSQPGIVQERLPGRTLEEADMHGGDCELLVQVAKTIASFHALPVPEPCAGEPMLWRALDKMMEAVARQPHLMPAGVPGISALRREITIARRAVEHRQPCVVLGHGDCKPSNIVVSCAQPEVATLIDFELSGPNYRGFDLMKLFRTASGFSEDRMRAFMLAYAESSGFRGAGAEEQAAGLLEEALLFEPLTWLEAAVFFLVMPQFKAAEARKWAGLARHRWDQYMLTRWRLELPVAPPAAIGSTAQ